MNKIQPDGPVKPLLYYARTIAALIVLAAFTAYGLAFYVWQQDQPLGAIVIATMGYLFFRSLRKITFNLTWQKFNTQPALRQVLERLGEHHLLKKEETVLQFLNQHQDKEKDDE